MYVSVLLLLPVLYAWADPYELTFDFDIDSEAANLALTEFAEQADLTLVFPDELVREKVANELIGRYTLQEGVDILLAGTGLIPTFSNEIVLSITTADTSANGGETMKASRKTGLMAIFAGVFLSGATGVNAEQAGAVGGNRNGEFEEIIVTAQKRAQRIEDVPISMTVLNSAELEALRVVNIEDYAYRLPNVTLQNQGSFYGKELTIRGVGAYGGLYDVNVVLVDDIGVTGIASRSMLATQLLDIERIEVLRGPQGTLYGRNSVGGAVNIITQKPSFSSFGGYATFDIGRFGTSQHRFAFNAPLAHNLALRLSAYGQESEGMIKNIGPGGGDSGYSNFGGRVAVRFEPMEALTIDASIGHERLNQGMEPWSTKRRSAEDEASHRALLTSWGGAFPGGIEYFDTVGNNGGTVSNDVRDYNKIEDTLAIVHASYDAGAYKLDLQYGHFEYDFSGRWDWDGTEYAQYHGSRERYSKSDAFELRVASDYNSPLNWVAGVSYLEDSLATSGGTWWGAYLLAGESTPRYAGQGGYNPTYLWRSSTELTSSGIYGSIFWDITEKLHLTGGLRWSEDKGRSAFVFNFDGASDPNLTTPPILDGDYDPEASLSQVSPRIALTYELNPDLNIYGQFATGYRAGYANDAFVVDLGAPAAVDNEHVKNYEIGLKGGILDNMVNFSLSSFYLDYTDLQVSTWLEAGEGINTTNIGLSYDINAGSATMKGVELEGQWDATSAFTLQGSVGYVKPVINKFIDVDVVHENIPVRRASPWTAAASAIYATSIDHDARLTLRADYQYQDQMQWLNIDETPEFVVPAFSTVDVSATVDRGNWSATAYFENIFDEQYYTGRFDLIWTYARGALVHTPPRMFGLRVNYEFGSGR